MFWKLKATQNPITIKATLLLIFFQCGALFIGSSLVLAASPKVTIESPADGRRYNSGSSIVLRGLATDTEEGNLTGDALEWSYVKDGLIDEQVSLGTGTRAVIPPDATAGTYVVTLKATDKDGNATSESIILTITDPFSNTAPEVTISNPKDGASFDLGDAIIFEAKATDAEDGPIPDAAGTFLSWYTSKNNKQIGSGNFIRVENLEAGRHTITCIATDTQKTTGSTSIEILVGSGTTTGLAPATVSITNPTCPETATGGGNTTAGGGNTTAGSANTTAVETICGVFAEGNSVIFNGTATDSDGNPITGGNLSWYSNHDDGIGSGSLLETNSLSEGTHVITLTASSGGISISDSIIIRIGNTPPKVNIIKPADGSVFYTGDAILFEGSALDVEDGSIPDAPDTYVEWYSHRSSKRLGFQPYIVLDNLAKGDHNITFIARDSSRETSSMTIKISIVDPPADTGSGTTDGTSGNNGTTDNTDTPPTATIIKPADGSVFNLGEYINFSGEGYDAQDGPIPQTSNTKLTWYTSLSKSALSKDAVFRTNDLEKGVHEITLEARDRDNNKGTATITITVVNTPPSVTIVNPPDGTIFKSGSPVLFEAIVLDSEQALVEDKFIVWTSSRGDTIPKGKFSLLKNGLSTGPHTIYLEAEDANGEKGRASTNITVLPPDPTDPTDPTNPDTTNPDTTNPDTTNPDTSTPTDSLQAVIIRPEHTCSDSDTLCKTFDRGDVIVFEGGDTANQLSGSSLVWVSNINGLIGTGTLFSRDDLNAGTHLITLKAHNPTTNETSTDYIRDLVIRDSGQSSNNSGGASPISCSDTIAADAGEIQNVGGNERVALDATQSCSTDGVLFYTWTQTAGTTVILSDPYSPQPVFTSPDVGTSGESLTFKLTVKDGSNREDSDNVIINVSFINTPPTADAGPDQTVKAENSVTLDGSNSIDVDGNIVAFNWVQTSGPKVALQNPQTEKLIFNAPTVDANGTSLQFELTVKDNGGLQGTDEVLITITNTGDKGGGGGGGGGCFIATIVHEPNPNFLAKQYPRIKKFLARIWK